MPKSVLLTCATTDGLIVSKPTAVLVAGADLARNSGGLSVGAPVSQSGLLREALARPMTGDAVF